MRWPKVKCLEVNMAELEAILEHTRLGPLSDEEHRQLKAVITTLGYLTIELEKKRTSITRLRHLLFGARTETTDEVLKQDRKQEDDSSTAGSSGKDKKKKLKGHVPGPFSGGLWGDARRHRLPHKRDGATGYSG